MANNMANMGDGTQPRGTTGQTAANQVRASRTGVRPTTDPAKPSVQVSVSRLTDRGAGTPAAK